MKSTVIEHIVDTVFGVFAGLFAYKLGATIGESMISGLLTFVGINVLRIKQYQQPSSH